MTRIGRCVLPYGGGSLPDPATYCPTNGYIDPTQPNDDWLILPKVYPKYGAHYNKYALTDSRNLCSAGWHIPTNAEVLTMTNYLGAWQTCGGKLKEVGTVYWQSPNTGASNSSGFNFRGAGSVGGTGVSSLLNQQGFIWCIDGTTALQCSYNSEARAIPGVGNLCLSVRPVKDTPTSLTNGQSGTYQGNDGKVYRTICIGTQEWLADNIKETKWRDGSLIEIVANNAWIALTYGIATYYNNDPSNA